MPAAPPALAASPSAQAAASAPAPSPIIDTPRPAKQSLSGELIEPHAPAPVAEVKDGAPTYPNESRPSIPLPYTYQMPRKSRDLTASAERHASERSAAGSLSASTAAPTLAAAQPHRDPVEWVKAILKLRSEGKSEQVLKELADFRKQHPQYVLPEELRNLR